MTHSTPSEAAQLLDIVRGISRELRPGANGLDRLGLDHQLDRDFGLDSLARVELLARIERELGARLTEAALIEADTPRDLLGQMGAAAPAQAPGGVTAEVKVAAAPERPPETLATLVDLLDWHAAQHGEKVHITLEGEGVQDEDISYRTLQAEARALAAGLVALGLGAGKHAGGGTAPEFNTGDRVAIMLPTGRAFFAAFYGALYAGCVPVPLYPPVRASQIEDHLRRVAGIVANSGAALLVTDTRAKPLGHLLRAQCPSLRGVETVDDLSQPGAALPLPLPPRATDTAFLQYTSGSTGNPKGVVLSHANLLANLNAMERAAGVTAADVFVSWLPLYHDMGLIGACMGSLYIGFRLVLMSPLAFLARPARWLWTIHRYRATVSAAPNFAYELCVNKLDDHELAGIDLGSWRLAYNGAEPVSPATMDRFATRFARYGFRASAMTPVYGLAESSVGLAFPPLGRGPLIDRVDRVALSRTGIARPVGAEDPAQRIVSCGLPLPDHAIRIVDADGRELPERALGRVQFQGPSATCGYFNNPEATRALFDGAWLNTGDLGYLAAGELFLTGREKDVIIRGGRNLHPQELEEAVSRLPGVRRGGVAVFPATDVRSGTERLVVLAEISDDTAANRVRIQAEINGLAVDLIGMPADDIVLAPPRTVLKTSSGKLRRAACRERYERGELLGAQRPPWQQWLRLAGAGAIAQARRRLGRAADAAWAAWAWAVYLVIVPLAWLLIAAVPTPGLRRRIARVCARLALALTGLTPRLSGMQQLAGLDGPLIVVANHASYLDALVLTAVLPPRFTYVAKQELLQKPLAAIPLRRLGSAFVERFDSVRGVEDTRVLEERLHAGESLVLFPEGTFRSEPGLLPFRLGAFMLAARSGRPVLPVTLIGMRTLLRGESSRPRYSTLEVRIGTPLSAEGEPWQAALQLRDGTRRQILAQVGEPDAAG